MHCVIESLEDAVADDRSVEIVERKGLGHPDSICDALAERLSLALSRFYRDRFGSVCHHNVDKVLLRGGASRPRFGGGQVLEPIEIFLAGRAVSELRGVSVPVGEMALEGSQAWLKENLRALDADAHVRIHSLVRPGSADLVELFERQEKTGTWLANDTSCGVGFAPLSELEKIVDRVERCLTGPSTAATHPGLGEDVKVMGVRRGDEIQLTVSCAFIDRHCRDVDDYAAQRAGAAELAREAARRLTGRDVQVQVNSGDDLASGSVFLTVTGTSAEAGDDGEAGRGNRVNGLITPARPMTMESVAGKNPVTHVGKLYNLVAGLIADATVAGLDEVREAECQLVSRIGGPVAEPQIVHVGVRTRDGSPAAKLEPAIDAIIAEQLAGIPGLADELLGGSLALDRWPLRQ